MRYGHHKFTLGKTAWGWTVLSWSLITCKGGIQLNVSIPHHGKCSPSCGLEFHRNTPWPQELDAPPDHLRCHVTEQPCWHDGTSLYASETLWPRIKPLFNENDHDAIFAILEREADRLFFKDVSE